MQKIGFITLYALLFSLLFFSCKEDNTVKESEKKVKTRITSPTNGKSYLLTNAVIVKATINLNKYNSYSFYVNDSLLFKQKPAKESITIKIKESVLKLGRNLLVLKTEGKNKESFTDTRFINILPNQEPEIIEPKSCKSA
jgi:hypothetical protein